MCPYQKIILLGHGVVKITHTFVIIFSFLMQTHESKEKTKLARKRTMLKLIRLYETSHIITSLLLLVMFEFLALAWTLETTYTHAVSTYAISFSPQMLSQFSNLTVYLSGKKLPLHICSSSSAAIMNGIFMKLCIRS